MEVLLKNMFSAVSIPINIILDFIEIFNVFDCPNEEYIILSMYSGCQKEGANSFACHV